LKIDLACAPAGQTATGATASSAKAKVKKCRIHERRLSHLEVGVNAQYFQLGFLIKPDRTQQLSRIREKPAPQARAPLKPVSELSGNSTHRGVIERHNPGLRIKLDSRFPTFSLHLGEALFYGQRGADRCDRPDRSNLLEKLPPFLLPPIVLCTLFSFLACHGNCSFLGDARRIIVNEKIPYPLRPIAVAIQTPASFSEISIRRSDVAPSPVYFESELSHVPTVSPCFS